MTKKDWENR